MGFGNGFLSKTERIWDIKFFISKFAFGWAIVIQLIVIVSTTNCRL